MRYFNQKGERVSNKEGEEYFANIDKLSKSCPKLTGWAIDVNKCDYGECEEFLRLWKKIAPMPLYDQKTNP